MFIYCAQIVHIYSYLQLVIVLVNQFIMVRVIKSFNYCGFCQAIKVVINKLLLIVINHIFLIQCNPKDHVFALRSTYIKHIT